MNAKLKLQRGFTLVELMIVVAIIGVLAALSIYGVTKYIANAKTAEARTGIGQIAKDAGSAFQRENMAGSVLSLDANAAITNRLCPAAVNIPASVPKAQKIQSNPASWAADAGWKCLKFSMKDPQYYQYQYLTTGDGSADGHGFDAVARGDLNGNGVNSEFKLSGKVQGGVLTVAPTPLETNPEE